MATLEIEGRKVEVDDSFLKLSPEEQERTVEEIAGQLGNRSRPQVMSQVNRGIVDAVGGLVDAINPFDQPHALNPFPEGTGSARKGLTQAMEAGGIEVTQGEPDGIVQGLQRGAGQAAGAMIPATKGLQVLGRAGGTIGQLADDAYRAMTTIGGATAEVAAGAASEGAREAVQEGGGPEWAQDSAAVLAGGVALPAATAAPRYMPSAVGGRQLVRATKRAMAPYTESGGREVARKRMQGLAGGPERAEELASRVETDNEFGLTPAQQTQDPQMLGVERLAGDQDPALRARLDERRLSSQDTARQSVRDMGGDPTDAEAFFQQRRQEFAKDLKARAARALEEADQQIARIGPERSETDNSLIVAREIDNALSGALSRQKELWDAVPRGAAVGTGNTKTAVERWEATLPYAQRSALPEAAREVLTAGNVYADTASVNDMHGLYSDLRETARNAMAGEVKNSRLANVANEIADAILKDLGTADGTTRVGRSIREALDYTRQLHETFDRGAVGKLLRRTRTGGEVVDPELSLKRSVSQSGVEPSIRAREIEDATEGRASAPIQDYVRDRFSRAVNSATGDFTYKSARTFIRDNKELLQRYPELRGEIDAAVLARENADQFSRRITERLAALESRKSAGRSVIEGRTVEAVLNAKSPAREASKLANEARRDKTGAALDGLKASFADHLIRNASGVKAGRETFSGDRLMQRLSEPKTKAALRQVFSASEIGRLQRIGREMAKLETGQAADVGSSLSGAKPARVIEFMARIVAARHGAEMGGGSGGSIQTAQMASSRTKELLGRLVSDKASEVMARAVEDPDLFKALMTDAASPKLDDRVLPRIVPYLVGTTASDGLSE